AYARRQPPRRRARPLQVYDLDQPIHTITAGGSSPLLRVEQGPGREPVIRPMTELEMLLVFGFPETMVIHGPRSAVKTQLGNSVPLPRGKAMARWSAAALRHAAAHAASGTTISSLPAEPPAATRPAQPTTSTIPAKRKHQPPSTTTGPAPGQL